MKMKIYSNLVTLSLWSLLCLFFMSCNDSETYADQKDAERSDINAFIAKRGIQVISESQFKAQNYTTDVSKNQYVLIESNGIYMQIEDNGKGEKIKNGETSRILCRFTERNVQADTLTLTNIAYGESRYVDKMTVTNNNGTFTGSFISVSESLLAGVYGSGSTAVPAGWLTPLTYITPGRKDEDKAKVNLILPHGQGHAVATANVRPYFYTITYQRGI